MGLECRDSTQPTGSTLTHCAILSSRELYTESGVNKDESQLLILSLASLCHMEHDYIDHWAFTAKDAQYLGHGCRSSSSTMQASFSRSSGHSFPPPRGTRFTFRLLLLNPGERLPERHVLEQGLQEDHLAVSQSFGMMHDWTVKGNESCVQRLKEERQKTVGHRLNRSNQCDEWPLWKKIIKTWNVV